MSSQIPGAGASLLHFLVHQAFSRDPREGIYGLAPEDVRLLTGLNLRQQRYLEERVPYFVEMKVDTERMRNMIRRAQECEQEYLLQQGLIRHGATQPLMQRWFGMGPAEFRGQCALVHDDPLPKGRRPTVLEAKLEGQVADALHTHQHVPVPERYLRVAEATGATVVAIVALEAEQRSDEQRASERREAAVRRTAVLSAAANGEGSVHVGDASAGCRKQGMG